MGCETTAKKPKTRAANSKSDARAFCIQVECPSRPERTSSELRPTFATSQAQQQLSMDSFVFDAARLESCDSMLGNILPTLPEGVSISNFSKDFPLYAGIFTIAKLTLSGSTDADAAKSILTND